MLYCLTYEELTALHERVIFAFSEAAVRVDGLPSLVTPSVITPALSCPGVSFTVILNLYFVASRSPVFVYRFTIFPKDVPVS